MSTITPTPTSMPKLKKTDWVIAGCIFFLFGMFVSFLSFKSLYKISKKHMFTNIALWLGVICLIIGAILLKHTSEVP